MNEPYDRTSIARHQVVSVLTSAQVARAMAEEARERVRATVAEARLLRAQAQAIRLRIAQEQKAVQAILAGHPHDQVRTGA